MTEAGAFKSVLARLAAGARLSEAEAGAAIAAMLSGHATPAQMGAFLMALRVRGETVAEITGAVRTLRAMALPITAPDGAIDIVGTGGDNSGTVNISTAAALVVAGCGVPVAKHGNRRASSLSGAADVLEALGVNIEADRRLVTRAMTEAGIGFLMAQRHHPAMKHVAPTRAELGTRTIFNLLGPLSNPAGVKRQLVGVFAPEWLEPVAEVLKTLGTERAWVVHGEGLDELTTTGRTEVVELDHGRLSRFDLVPEAAGLERASLADLRGGDANANAAIITALLKGAPGPVRDVVVYNAAAALVVAGRVGDVRTGVDLARAAIDDGSARRALERLVAITNAVPPP